MTSPYEVLAYLEKIAQQRLHKNFIIHKLDHPAIFRLIGYFMKNKSWCDGYKIDPQKGIFLNGPIGCGKTILLKLMNLLASPEDKFSIVNTRDIAREFEYSGIEVINSFSKVSLYHKKPRIICFDELGSAGQVKYYGNPVNVMKEILMIRYDLYIKSNVVTHMISTLSASEIEKYYGKEVRSRMRQMFNHISMDNLSPDKRK